MPLVWNLGSIIGPMIGGALARPCISYPELFSRGTIFDRFPYLLPNLFSACAVLMGVFIGILFLEETHADKKHRRDPGRELGKTLVNWMHKLTAWMPSYCYYKKPEKQNPLLGDNEHQDEDDHEGQAQVEQLPSYSTMDETPSLAAVAVAASDPQDPLGLTEQPPCESEVPVKVFTRPVVLNIVEYGILAL